MCELQRSFLGFSGFSHHWKKWEIPQRLQGGSAWPLDTTSLTVLARNWVVWLLHFGPLYLPGFQNYSITVLDIFSLLDKFPGLFSLKVPQFVFSRLINSQMLLGLFLVFHWRGTMMAQSWCMHFFVLIQNALLMDQINKYPPRICWKPGLFILFLHFCIFFWSPQFTDKPTKKQKFIVSILSSSDHSAIVEVQNYIILQAFPILNYCSNTNRSKN